MCIVVPAHWKPPSNSTLLHIMKIPNHLSGPKPLIKSLPVSPDFVSELLTQDTRSTGQIPVSTSLCQSINCGDNACDPSTGMCKAPGGGLSPGTTPPIPVPVVRSLAIPSTFWNPSRFVEAFRSIGLSGNRPGNPFEPRTPPLNIVSS